MVTMSRCYHSVVVTLSGISVWQSWLRPPAASGVIRGMFLVLEPAGPMPRPRVWRRRLRPLRETSPTAPALDTLGYRRAPPSRQPQPWPRRVETRLGNLPIAQTSEKTASMSDCATIRGQDSLAPDGSFERFFRPKIFFCSVLDAAIALK
jgi:hypothetical protein